LRDRWSGARGRGCVSTDVLPFQQEGGHGGAVLLGSRSRARSSAAVRLSRHLAQVQGTNEERRAKWVRSTRNRSSRQCRIRSSRRSITSRCLCCSRGRKSSTPACAARQNQALRAHARVPARQDVDRASRVKEGEPAAGRLATPSERCQPKGMPHERRQGTGGARQVSAVVGEMGERCLDTESLRILLD